MVKVACYGEMHSTVDNFFAKVLFIFELVCEILFLILIDSLGVFSGIRCVNFVFSDGIYHLFIKKKMGFG